MDNHDAGRCRDPIRDPHESTPEQDAEEAVRAVRDVPPRLHHRCAEARGGEEEEKKSN